MRSVGGRPGLCGALPKSVLQNLPGDQVLSLSAPASLLSGLSTISLLPSHRMAVAAPAVTSASRQGEGGKGRANSAILGKRSSPEAPPNRFLPYSICCGAISICKGGSEMQLFREPQGCHLLGDRKGCIWQHMPCPLGPAVSSTPWLPGFPPDSLAVPTPNQAPQASLPLLQRCAALSMFPEPVLPWPSSRPGVGLPRPPCPPPLPLSFSYQNPNLPSRD